MGNLYNAYQQIFSKKRNWKYYNKGLDINTLPLLSEDEAWAFIEKYYKAGEKNEVFDKFVDKSKLRNSHTVSVFFLGILLSDAVLGSSYKQNLDPDFRYLWFIASLYHDYSYIIEGNKKYKVSNYLELNEINKKFSVSYKLLEESTSLTLDRALIKSYYRFRIEEHQKIDHGIVGGILLYDRLRKNYDFAYERQKVLHPNTSKELFKFHGLLFSECQYDYFAQVADTVIAHNIWFCTTSGDRATYRKYGLKKLILGDRASLAKKHKRDTNPFLFLLVLADTLEPIKREEFKKYSAQEILEKISIWANSDGIFVEVLDDSLNHQRWFDSIKGLEDWMQVKVKINVQNLSIEIL